MSENVERVEQSYDEDALATAFIAGFLASDEGWNGEYPDRDEMTPDQINVVFAKVLESFDLWMLDVAVSAGE